MLDSYKWMRKLLDDYYGKMQTAALLDNGATVGKIQNYWPMRSTMQNNSLEWKDNKIDIFDRSTYNTNFSESRTYGTDDTRVFKSHFIDTINRFADVEVRYAEGVADYNKVKSLIKDGNVLEGLNEYSRDVVDQLMKDTASPRYVENAWYSPISSFFAQNLMWMNPVSYISQFLSIVDASIKIDKRHLATALIPSTKPSILMGIQDASKAMKIA